jgi:hypothetical protein
MNVHTHIVFTEHGEYENNTKGWEAFKANIHKEDTENLKAILEFYADYLSSDKIARMGRKEVVAQLVEFANEAMG